jgi:hypothetical protein
MNVTDLQSDKLLMGKNKISTHSQNISQFFLELNKSKNSEQSTAQATSFSTEIMANPVNRTCASVVRFSTISPLVKH